MGAPESVFLQERELEAIGLGVPAAQHMASKLRERGVPMPDHTLYSIESLADMLAPALASKVGDSYASAPRSTAAPDSATAFRSTASPKSTAKEDAR